MPPIYGPSARGRLRAFAATVSGTLLTDFPKPVEQSWEVFSVSILNRALEAGTEVWFDLTYVQNLTGILGETGEYADAVTAIKLRYLRQHWAKFRSIVQFYENGAKRNVPWE